MSQQVMERKAQTATRWTGDGKVALLAAGAAALVWVVATQAGGVDLAVRSGSGTQHITVVSVVVTTLVVTLAAAGLLRILERRTTRGWAIWTAIAGSVWVVSFAGPLGARSVSAGLVLAALHLLVGAVVVVGLRRHHADRVA
jgi:hypothetical protein